MFCKRNGHAGVLTFPCAGMQEKAAETGMLIAYRTVQYPQSQNCSESGKAYDHQIGYRYHVTYLNSAGRQVNKVFLLAGSGAGTRSNSC